MISFLGNLFPVILRANLDNKKYAIFYYLFTKENALFKGKTVLVFTHDFDFVIDFIFKKSLKNIRPKIHYVSNENGSLHEKVIKQENVKRVVKQWENKATKPNYNELIRVVNLRKYLEYNNDEDPNKNAWNILSSICHLDMVPMNECETLLNPDEIDEGNKIIKRFIQDFDYIIYLNKIRDKNNLINWYENTTSDLDKIQILRAILYLKPSAYLEHAVFMDFITEAYDVENNTLKTLQETRYKCIPSYIMNICDQIIDDFKKINQ